MTTYDPAYMEVRRLITVDKSLRLLGPYAEGRVSSLMMLTARKLLQLPRMTTPVALGVRWSLQQYDWDLTTASPQRWCEYERLTPKQVHRWYWDAKAEELLQMRGYRLIISKWAPQGRIHNRTCQYFQEEPVTPLIRRDQLGQSVDCHQCGGAFRTAP